MNKAAYIMVSLFILCIGCKNNDPGDESYAEKNADTTLRHTAEHLPLEEFNRWATKKENSLLKERTVGKFKYTLEYMPKECLAFLELRSSAYSLDQYQEALTHYDGMSYFNFILSVNEGEGELLKQDLSSAQQYNDRINYMSFQMQKDIFLVQGKDTVYPGLYHFERIFDVAPKATTMIAFDNKKFDTQKEFTVVFNDKLFHKGFIKYYYRTNLIIDLPNISGV